MKELSALIHEYLKPEGVIGAGIATIETLAGGRKGRGGFRLAFEPGCNPGLPGEKGPDYV